MLRESIPSAVRAILTEGATGDTAALMAEAGYDLLVSTPSEIRAVLELEIPGWSNHLPEAAQILPGGGLVVQYEATSLTVRNVLEGAVTSSSILGFLHGGRGEPQPIERKTPEKQAMLSQVAAVPVGRTLLLSDFLATPGWTPDVNWFFSRAAGRRMAQELMAMPEDERQALVSAGLVEVNAGLSDPARRMQHGFFQAWRDTLERGVEAVVQALTGVDDNRSQEIRCSVPRSMASRLLPPKEGEALREGVCADLERWRQGGNP